VSQNSSVSRKGRKALARSPPRSPMEGRTFDWQDQYQRRTPHGPGATWTPKFDPRSSSTPSPTSITASWARASSQRSPQQLGPYTQVLRHHESQPQLAAPQSNNGTQPKGRTCVNSHGSSARPKTAECSTSRVPTPQTGRAPPKKIALPPPSPLARAAVPLKFDKGFNFSVDYDGRIVSTYSNSPPSAEYKHPRPSTKSALRQSKSECFGVENVAYASMRETKPDRAEFVTMRRMQMKNQR
jgi:hypothetical protein